jgi:RNA polymerase sigma-70 factor, ECF subfamily
MSRDHSLMQRVQAGDVSALDEVLQRYWQPLVSYAAGLIGDQDRAEDAAQEAILRLWNRRTEWDPSPNLRAFLYQITRNLALTANARAAARERRREAAQWEPTAPVPTPLEVLQGNALRERIEARIVDLPPRQREVFILARYHGHSYREIAEIMDVSPQTVANQMSSALAQVREAIRPPSPRPSASREPSLR